MARSQAEIDRQEGRYQVEAQREAILEAVALEVQVGSGVYSFVYAAG